MKRNKLFITMFTTLFILIFICQFSYGEEAIGVDKNVYIVVVNKLTLSDIEGMPALNNLIDEGNIGLMNVRGISGYKGAESFITMNASSKTYANNESSQFYNLNKEYKGLYENRVGMLDREYAIGNIQTGRLYNQNENNKYSPYIGLLGDNLHEKGLKTAVWGNSDTLEETIRSSALILMDSKGLIDYGNIDNILMEDMDYPYGIKTDYKKVLKEISDIRSKASSILVDTGDLNRLNNYSDLLSMDVFNYKRDLILKDIDNFIGNLINTLEKENSLVIIISPNSGEERVGGGRLSPVILWGEGIRTGTITSSTTNREGIVSNLDIGPTVSNFLKVSLKNMSGSPIRAIEKEKAIDFIRDINDRINTTSKVRTKTLLTYGIVSIIILLLTTLFLLLNIKMNDTIGELFKILLILLYGLPIIFILSSIFTIDNLLKFFISIILITVLFIAFIKKYMSKNLIFFITGSYFVIIVLDILSNGNITKFSILSHDPIIGARYFGIGNEMVGLFLGITTIIAGSLLEKYNKNLIPIFVLLLSVFLVVNPELGANVGGTIAILVATIYFILETIGKQLNFKTIIFIGIIIGIVILAMGYIDITLNSNPTHLGKSLLLLNDKGISIAQNIINRKLLMNIKLVGTSIWTKVLFINILVQGTLLHLYNDKMESLMKDGLEQGVLSGIVGSIIGFLLNDSGVILSAICMNLITIFLLFIIINDEEISIKQEVD